MTADDSLQASKPGCHNMGSVVALTIRIRCNSPGLIEIAVIDACTGLNLMNTLVNAGVTINPEAHAVHGLTETDLLNAPDWRSIMPKLRKITRDKSILAYNAEFDRAVILGECARYGLRPMHLAAPENWGCLMNRRSDWLATNRSLALGGAHRALGDCHAARDLLLQIARREPDRTGSRVTSFG